MKAIAWVLCIQITWVFKQWWKITRQIHSMHQMCVLGYKCLSPPYQSRDNNPTVLINDLSATRQQLSIKSYHMHDSHAVTVMSIMNIRLGTTVRNNHLPSLIYDEECRFWWAYWGSYIINFTFKACASIFVRRIRWFYFDFFSPYSAEDLNNTNCLTSTKQT